MIRDRFLFVQTLGQNYQFVHTLRARHYVEISISGVGQLLRCSHRFVYKPWTIHGQAFDQLLRFPHQFADKSWTSYYNELVEVTQVVAIITSVCLQTLTYVHTSVSAQGWQTHGWFLNPI